MSNFPTCQCGCGEYLSNSRASFRQGHDARLAGNCAKFVLDPFTDGNLQNLPPVFSTNPEVVKHSRRKHGASAAVLADMGRKRLGLVCQILMADLGRPALADKVTATVTRKWGGVKPAEAPSTDAEPEKASPSASEPAEALSAHPEPVEPSEGHDNAEQVQEGMAYRRGRWTYPVRMTSSGMVQRNSSRDGSGTWVRANMDEGKLVRMKVAK